MCYPAAYDDYVIAVGATRYDETLAYYSNYGLKLDLAAPGGDLNVDQNGDDYGDGILQQTGVSFGTEWIGRGSSVTFTINKVTIGSEEYDFAGVTSSSIGI